MLIPASSEFISLCQCQTTLLTQGLGASSSGVYLAEDLVEGTPVNLIPVVVYPEPDWAELGRLTLPTTSTVTAPAHLPSAKAANAADIGSEDLLQAAIGSNGALLSLSKQRLVLPLMDQQLVIGLLVVEREDRQWNQGEQVQLEQIANTLAIARILDQRYQWTVHSRQHQRLLQAQQQDTLADLLHQFRNPLTTLRTLGKLLLKRLGPADTSREIATSIIRESERLQDLLQQFDLTIDRDLALEAPDPRVQRQLADGTNYKDAPPVALLPSGGAMPLEPCLVAQVLDPLLRSAAAIAGDRHLELHAEVPPLPPVWANPQALREVLSNLIDNALKYTPAPGQVSIQVSQKGAELSGGRAPLLDERFGEESFPPKLSREGPPEKFLVEPVNYQVIAVHDTGPGIPPQDLDHLFERHYRGVQSQTGIPGTGLGLAIAQELVKQMQGEIQVFSPAQSPKKGQAGPGSTFEVWLPEIKRL